MKHILAIGLAFSLFAVSLIRESRAAEPELKRIVADAIAKLASTSNYSWTTDSKSDSDGPFGGKTSLCGQLGADGTLYVAGKSSDSQLEFARKGDHVAVVMDGNWMSREQALERSPRLEFWNAPSMGAADTNTMPLPTLQAEQLLKNTESFSRSGDEYKGKVNEAFASQVLLPRTRGGRGIPAGLMTKEVVADAVFVVRDGAMSRFSITVTGTIQFGTFEGKTTRTTTTEISHVGETRIAAPVDALEILSAAAEGRPHRVFVPEPGFRKLFGGSDLKGWKGRDGFWSVEDRAIVGRTTADRPTNGNTFLIAMNGDKPLSVDDFELRFSYRIEPNNAEGFANSGVQYRSKEIGEFVVGGYQADFEAGPMFSGILYDEAGGAGGRGIMALRGELVTWDSIGQKKVNGRLASSEEIQSKIRPNDWNEYTIVVEGNRIQHFINGVQTVGVIDETEGKRRSSGILALQLHAGPPMTVKFKDIRIKSLSNAEMIGSANIRLAKDFAMELLYTVPKETEGSWVTMCLDPKGRLIVCDQYGSLHRVTLPAFRGAAVKTERINLDIGDAHGLLYAFDSLYVAANEGSRPHGVYRVRDTDGDDQFDSVELLRQVNAAGEHGLHSLVLSPDGKSIYVVIGNQSSLTEMASSRVPMNWGEDDLLPRLATGFMDDSLAPQGYISKMDPDGKNWELIAMGLRNEFDVAFNKHGELFTYDADMEWDIGEPWYRPTRVNHVISGAEFGFRNGNGKWPDYYLDSFGAVVDVGPGSPTGISFGYGAKFPAKYQDALFLADWSFGKVRAVHLSPSGSTYTGQVEDFISGQPFPVTDFLIHPGDGSMLLAVGGRGAQSALYRVTYIGGESTEPSQPRFDLQAERDRRHAIEKLHGKPDSGAVERAWGELGSDDPAIRYAARIAIEWQDPIHWENRALTESDPRKAIPALVALARVSGRDSYHQTNSSVKMSAERQAKMLSALHRIDWNKLATGDRIDLLRAYSLVLIRGGKPEAAPSKELIERLDPLMPSQSPQINMLLARLLIYLEAPSAARKVIGSIQSAPTQEEQIDYGVALRSLKSGWTPALRRTYFEWFASAEGFRGGNTLQSSLRTAKNQAIQSLTAAELAELQPILEAKVEHKSARDLLAARPVVKQWTLEELTPIVETGLKGGRDFIQGRRAYHTVACSVCHRFANEGGSVGPELTSVVGRYSVKDLLESMVHPSKVISDQYQAIVIHTNEGKVVTGRIANLGSGNVSVVEDMFDAGRMTNVKRSDIESMEPSKVSMMPEGLLNTLTAEEIQDLCAYVLSRGDSQAPAFR